MRKAFAPPCRPCKSLKGGPVGDISSAVPPVPPGGSGDAVHRDLNANDICNKDEGYASTSDRELDKKMLLKRKPLQIVKLNVKQTPLQRVDAKICNDNECKPAYFSVMYTKRAPQKKRKNKSFQDGILEAGGDGACALYNMDGKVISRGKVKGSHSMPGGAELEVGNWEVLVEALLDEASFRAGRCFTHVAELVENNTLQHIQQVQRQGLSKRPRFTQSQADKPVKEHFKGPLHDPHAADAVLLNREEWCRAPDTVIPVVIDPYISRQLRPHQHEGVAFLYRCMSGLVDSNLQGAILADEMGLGKTLQIVTLIWTLLRQGPQGKPLIRKAIIVSPSSLIHNFAKESKRWLGSERLKVLVLEPGPEAPQQVLDFKFGSIWGVLALSYETIRKFSDDLAGCCDLLICDEGHRLKAAGGNKTMNALLGLKCPRRIILTGTPMQNNLEEYYAMVSFVCPGLLGPLAAFKKVFAEPIARSNERDATPEEKALSLERSNELMTRVGKFMLRRTSIVNSAYLPPLTNYVVFCKLTVLQEQLYKTILQSSQIASLLTSSSQMSCVLPAISALRKVCNHPDLLWNKVSEDADSRGLRLDSDVHFPEGYSPDASPNFCGKLRCLEALLKGIIEDEKDHVVVASQSTAALDLISSMCCKQQYSVLRIDGSIHTSKRADIVSSFNSGIAQVCLLSTRAGGAGLNLIGANYLVLYDPDWNPAMDLQAMSRIWRDGQRKPCHVFRLLSTGSVEEKIYQRQLMKGDLAKAVNSVKEGAAASFTRDELRELFTLKKNTVCDTRDLMLGGDDAAAWEEDQSHQVQATPLQAAVVSGAVSYVHIARSPPAFQQDLRDEAEPANIADTNPEKPLSLLHASTEGVRRPSEGQIVAEMACGEGSPCREDLPAAAPLKQFVMNSASPIDSASCLEIDF
eukprot:jgi/Botrbrau1/21715/Bobra.43_1s0110.1